MSRIADLTAQLAELESRRLAVAAERDAAIVEADIGPRPLAREMGVSVETARRVRDRARANAATTPP